MSVRSDYSSYYFAIKRSGYTATLFRGKSQHGNVQSAAAERCDRNFQKDWKRTGMEEGKVTARRRERQSCVEMKAKFRKVVPKKTRAHFCLTYGM